jgi:ribosomal protein S18 acetylase RimI-like enzyme
MATIVPAQPENVEDVRRISLTVFDEYGDYGRILPRFFTTQGVTTYVARIQQEVVGYVMLGFLPWSGGEVAGNPWIGDLLAIAVEPGHQCKGIGDALMRQVFELVGQMGEWREVREIHLTCAESNQRGRKFFARYGFDVQNPDHGNYSGGQKALRLACPVPRKQ